MEDSGDLFLEVWFPKLPWPIIKEVLHLLPAEIIQHVLLKVPYLRGFISELYYNDDLHLILTPNLRGHICSEDPQKLELRDFVSFVEIEDFLDQNPDINPRTYKVFSGLDYLSLEILLQKYYHRLSCSESLDLFIDQFELNELQLEFLFSFPNIRKLQTARVKFTSTKRVLAEKLQELKSLKELVLLGSAVSDWSDVVFPASLEHLDVSWILNLNVASFNLPDSMSYLYWNQVGIVSSVFENLKLPPALRTLMLSYNSLESINVSSLPQTLHTIDLSNNGLKRFECDLDNAKWPPMLESIMLNSNFMSDESMKQLRKIKWPESLRNLRLDMNPFTTLEFLDTLPPGLKYLDLSETLLHNLQVNHNHDDYPFYVFPKDLETLNILCCRNLDFDEFESSASGGGHLRLKFPEELQTLNLVEANCENLGHFIFPKGLKSLALSGNRIKDINSYNLIVNGDAIVSWSQLTNLRVLDLFFNLIEGLQGWKPPKSLHKLDLRKNNFKILTLVNTPLFNKNYSSEFGLREIRFDENSIHTIDPNFSLPDSMIKFNLSGNLLSQFSFTEHIGNHPNLGSIDLSKNNLEKVSVFPTDAQYHSSLYELILTRNHHLGQGTSPETFYRTLEQLDLRPSKMKRNIKTEHRFILK